MAVPLKLCLVDMNNGVANEATDMLVIDSAQRPTED